MRLQKYNDRYRAWSITGPTHNLLGLVFSDRADDQIIVEELRPHTVGAHRLTADAVRESVLRGVGNANLRLGTDYRVSKIQFVPNDTPLLEIYARLAEGIVEQLARNGEWKEC
jgi:hypothetical protein